MRVQGMEVCKVRQGERERRREEGSEAPNLAAGLVLRVRICRWNNIDEKKNRAYIQLTEGKSGYNPANIDS